MTDLLPRVLFALLAKDKEATLPLFLRCIEALDYPKERICLWVRTNNNTDRTRDILWDWLQKHEEPYGGWRFDDTDTSEDVQKYASHEWNCERFKVLGRLRQESMDATLTNDCDFYFVVDCDNFLTPDVLKNLVTLNLPIVAPMLEHTKTVYSNFHSSIDASGYYANDNVYIPILGRKVRGVIAVEVVHCTYLVRADVIPLLTYDDESYRYEYVIFSDSARKNGVEQWLDNRFYYGCLTTDESPEQIAAAEAHLANHREPKRMSVFDRVYARNEWGGAPGELFSGGGSDERFALPYVQMLWDYLQADWHVVDLGCGDFRVGQQLRCLNYVGVDCVSAVIEHNRVHWPDVHFRCLDIVNDPLPPGRVALLRQVLQHLSNADILKLLPKLRQYEFVFVTDHVPEEIVAPNLDQATGPGLRYYQSSCVVLDAPPFNLEHVVSVLEQQHDNWGKLVTYLVTW